MKKFLSIDYGLIYIVFVLITSDGFFYIFNNDITSMSKKSIYIISLIMFLVFVFKYLSRWKSFKFRNIILMFVILALIIEPINSFRIYGQPIFLGTYLNLKYLLYLNYFFIAYYINKNKENRLKLEKALIFISIIASIIYILQYIMLPNIFLKGMDYRINYRFGEPRFYISTLLFAITYILSLVNLIFYKTNIKEKILYGITIFLNTFMLINVVKTRTIMIAILFCIVFCIFLKVIRSNPIKATLFLIICSVVIVLFLSSDTVSKMLHLTSTNDYSLKVRSNEIKFYIEQFKEYLLFGRGEIKRDMFPLIDGIINGYYLDDLGFIGIIVKLGIFGIIIFLISTLKIIKSLFVKHVDYRRKVFLIIISLYILISGIFIPYLDQGESIIGICFILAYVDNIKDNSLIIRNL